MIEMLITTIDRRIAQDITRRRQEADKSRVNLLYHPRLSSFDTANLGDLAEVVAYNNLDIKRNGLTVQHGGSFGADFINHNGVIFELKATDGKPKEYVQTNVEWLARKKYWNILGEFIIFSRFDGFFKYAKKIRLLGWKPTREIETYPIDPYHKDITPSYHIPIGDLYPITDDVVRKRERGRQIKNE